MTSLVIEENWRKCPPDVFVEPHSVHHGIWKVHFEEQKKEALQQTLSQEFGANLAPSVLSHLYDHLDQLCLIIIDDHRAKVIQAPSLELQVKSEERKATPILSKSFISQTLVENLYQACPHALTISFEKKDPIFLVKFLNDSPTDEILQYVRFEIKDHIKAQCFIFEDEKTERTYSQKRIDFVIHDHAELNQNLILKDGATHRLFERFVVLNEHAKFFEHQFISSNSKIAKLFSCIDFEGAHAESKGGTAMLAKKGLFDYEPIQRHKAVSGKSDLLVNMIGTKKSRSIFQGLIHVTPKGDKTDARQINKNLLLSEYARIDAVPRLEIIPNDVMCKHGTATSGLDENQIYYLETRGFKKSEAENILIHAFLLRAAQDDSLFLEQLSFELKEV